MAAWFSLADCKRVLKRWTFLSVEKKKKNKCTARTSSRVLHSLLRWARYSFHFVLIVRTATWEFECGRQYVNPWLQVATCTNNYFTKTMRAHMSSIFWFLCLQALTQTTAFADGAGLQLKARKKKMHWFDFHLFLLVNNSVCLFFVLFCYSRFL